MRFLQSGQDPPKSAEVDYVSTANTAAYFIVLPKNLVSHSNTVALDFGKAIFGPAGGIAFAIVVAVSCFGALNR